MPTERSPLVSVIIPTFNYAHLIGETFDSLYAQTYDRWEVIVVDDGSTDDTVSVVADHMRRDQRIKFLQQKNQRQAVARNLGIQNCSGRYVQFLDADDMIEPKKFEIQVDFLERHPEVDLVYGNIRYFRAYFPKRAPAFELCENESRVMEVRGCDELVLEPLIRTNIMPINAPLVRRQVIDEVGPFDDVLPPVEDWDYWVRCAMLGKTFCYDGPEGTLSLVRRHPTSSSQNSVSMMRSMLRMREKIRTATPDRKLLRINREKCAYLEAWLGINAVGTGNILEGVRRILKASLISDNLNWKLKLAACAALTPFISHERLGRFAASSVAEAGRAKVTRDIN